MDKITEKLDVIKTTKDKNVFVTTAQEVVKDLQKMCNEEKNTELATLVHNALIAVTQSFLRLHLISIKTIREFVATHNVIVALAKIEQQLKKLKK